MNQQQLDSPGTNEDIDVPGSDATARTALEIGVASRLDQVVAAWQLVYQAYRRIEIINANPAEVHTSPLAISPQTAVIVGTCRDEVASTLTMMHDSERGLPLDDVYSRPMAALRQRGEKLMEVGLLADRRAKASRAIAAIFGMMRFVFYNARFTRSIIVCGVHPHHAGFYMKSFGFEVAAPETTHPGVNNQPVIFLRLDLDQKLQLDPLPRGLAMYVADPLAADTFDVRFPLTATSVAHTPIGAFLGQPHAKPRLDVLRAG